MRPLLPPSWTVGQSRSNRKVTQIFKPRTSNARRSSFHDLLWNRKPPSHSHAGSTAGNFANIRSQFEGLQHLGPNHGYFPISVKSILVGAPHNVEQAKVEFAGLTFQVDTGARYLGSFKGEVTERDSWIANT